jgi:hypothetical protein
MGKVELPQGLGYLSMLSHFHRLQNISDTAKDSKSMPVVFRKILLVVYHHHPEEGSSMLLERSYINLPEYVLFIYLFIFAVTLRPNAGHGLILEVF